MAQAPQQYNRGGPGGGRDGGGGGAQGLVMPNARPVQYFSDPEKKALTRALVDESARALGENLKEVPASQIRRFYSDVTTFERRLSAESLPDDAIQAQMALLKAKAAYAHKRAKRGPGFPPELLQFFVDHAGAIKDRKDFDAFRRIFEAVIAYHKFYEVKRGN